MTSSWYLASLKATKLQDVIDEVAKSEAQYNQKKGNLTLYKRITSFSKRIAYYGKVLDVMVQHHPEYVALAWGTLKFMFGAVIEHERLGSTIVTALDDIGEALSRIELAESLYPTERMNDAVVTLNCHVITFLCRALDWYRSSSLGRTIQSITRPAALRYDDLIKDISKTLAKVTDLSVAGGQAEQRDMHENMRQEHRAQQNFRSIVQNRLDEMEHQLNTLVQQNYSVGDFRAIRQQIQEVAALVKLISENQTSSEQTLLQALVLMKQDIQATQLDIRVQVSEVQFNQAVASLFTRCDFDHQAAYEQGLAQRRARRMISGRCAPFWDTQQFQTWDRLDTCRIITLTSNLRDRLNVRDFYVGIIEQLTTSHIPVFWIAKQKDHRNYQVKRHGLLEVSRSLAAQTLKAALTRMDAGLFSRIANFNAATSVGDYTSLLVDNLCHFNLAYFFVDADAILPESMEDCHKVLLKVSDLLRKRNKDAIIKIMLLNHEIARAASGVDRRQSAVIKIAQTSKRKSRRVPQAPLKGSIRAFVSLR
ncbi:hypothetical protein FB567DRAFT_596170 [Paraphoma chrysanthemicola]|uniref:DUF7708 domain-containing protein n=1 Tax=Paraphoma chrysanthemicola TaxID=798071 RepID=A0A8K0VUV4_9PLEO|nr:hypothetical protein FB567DRAFT_596170 [Paraphoma chrysanthemicola]